MSGAVFLSYASQDAEAARRIRDALRAAGIEVWFDQSELRGGDAWDGKIRKQIKECALFVPIISANTQARHEGYFRLEWRLADHRTHHMGRGKAFLLPVCVDDTCEKEPDVPDSFLSVHWTRLRDAETETGFAQRVATLVAEPAPSTQPPFGPAVAVAGSGLPGQPRPAVRIPKRSVAVLAFTNLSGDPANEYFSDGISEELLNVLAKVSGLRVTARTSSFHFKGRNTPIPEIGQMLGVAYVVEGSVRRSGNQVRITAQLIATADGFHVWADSFDRELKDIFALQDEVAGLIAHNLQLKLEAVVRRQTVDPEAYRLYLEGRRELLALSHESLARAETLFQQARELDPDLASAAVGLAQVGLARLSLSAVAARFITAELTQAEEQAREALRADPNYVEPHAVLGYVALHRGQLADAESAFERVIEKCPTFEQAVVPSAFLYLRLGRPDRASAAMELAHRVNPLSWLPLDLRGVALLQWGRYEEALESFQRAERAGAPLVARANTALAFVKLGRAGEAVAAARLALNPELKAGWPRGFAAMIDGRAGWALAEAGARGEAEAVARRLVDEPEGWRWAAAMPLAALGRAEEACALFADMPQHFVGLTMFFLNETRALQEEPRRTELLRRLEAVNEFETLRRVIAPGP